MNSNLSNWMDTQPTEPLSADELASLQQGIEDVIAGRVIPAEEVRKTLVRPVSENVLEQHSHPFGEWVWFYKNKYNEYHISVPNGAGQRVTLNDNGIPDIGPTEKDLREDLCVLICDAVNNHHRLSQLEAEIACGLCGKPESEENHVLHLCESCTDDEVSNVPKAAFERDRERRADKERIAKLEAGILAIQEQHNLRVKLEDDCHLPNWAVMILDELYRLKDEPHNAEHSVRTDAFQE